ncbi:hypothetical protein PUNSTDRAFT_112734 [Punctularia strigosozonata HHB-11173 SS5]|uniref:uncharacterized protein n=1 Tax=Punctularia strigosozonata (strain HHB-11173) TaxID=741275 RepID=UPI0004416674|nr:uncharacterized protein PUNSTDRAFT_112734 [Punctularia strigosozonata HHB-11173 SS5]EIN10948.1 hypothetical protein PUNSTDRAFT_112734 [Punctularia strigosozonata HHB-11173 SS5]
MRGIADVSALTCSFAPTARRRRTISGALSGVLNQSQAKTAQPSSKDRPAASCTTFLGLRVAIRDSFGHAHRCLAPLGHHRSRPTEHLPTRYVRTCPRNATHSPGISDSFR